ncbi:MAG: hypothetical protein DHS20C18_45490 [Saprospiraceae bacterium]|nr:MAG: hypothetical protein DHS20C18_45490 [Saprospiraceae bacterium]
MRILYIFPLLLIANGLLSQGSSLPLGSNTYHILDRLEIKTGLPTPYHSTLKGYTRGDATQYALSVDTATGIELSALDREDLRYIFLDNSEWLGQAINCTTLAGRREAAAGGLTQMQASMADPRFALSKKPILKYFYQTPANFFDVNDKHFHIRVNPMLNFSIAHSVDDTQPVFHNQRGLEVRGGVDDRIYFYMNILESQSRFPDYVNNYIGKYNAVPGAGLYKSYKSSILDIDQGFDYLNGQGYLGFNVTQHVGFQFGYGRNFLGNGYRSLLLSDFAQNYLYLKLNWRVWRFHYQNLFAELTPNAFSRRGGDVIKPKKYMAAHHFSFRLLPNLELGFYEVVVFSRNNQFELQYLNPVILYRLVEHGLGSPDNVLIGLEGKWDLWKRFQLYGQLMLDEFKFNELVTDNQGWWANKYGIQAGIKYIDALGVDHLDVQLEYNTVRPYTYTHGDSSANYSHYNQSLAHPLGANFREWVALMQYQPAKNWIINARLISGTFGEDGTDQNWGGNILLPNITREQEYGNEIGQGITTQTLLAGLDVSYRLAHNLFLDFNYFYRRQDSDDDNRDNKTQYIGGGIRINMARQRFDF